MATIPNPMTPRLSVLKALNVTMVAKRFTRAVKGVFITDSIGLYGATRLENSFVSLIQNWFDEQFPTPGIPAPVNGIPNFLHFSADYAVGFPYPMYYEPGRVGVPGKMSSGYGDGFGQQANVQGPGSARFKKTKQSTAGVFLKFTKATDVARILVDGVLRKTVTAAPVGEWVEYRINGFNGVEEPEVRVEFVAGSVRYDGQAAYRGNESKGFQMWDSGHSGYGTNQMTDEGPAGSDGFMDIFGVGLSGAPDFVYISLGTNDGGYSAAVFLDKRRNLVKAIRERYPNTIIIDVMLQEPSPFAAGVWDGFIAGSHQLASEFPNYIVFDFSKFIAKQSKGTSGFMYDSLHPNDAGYRRMRDVFVNYFMGVVDLGIEIPAPAAPGTGGTTPVVTQPAGEAIPSTPSGWAGFAFTGSSLAEQFSVWSPDLRAAFPGISFINRAKGGSLSEQQAAFQGGEPAKITFPSSGIPASNAVPVTVTVEPNIMALPGVTGTWSTTGYVAGVNGTLTVTKASSGAHTYTFKRTTSGTAVVVSTPATFLTGYSARNRSMVAELFRNDAFETTPAVAMSRWRNMKAWSTVKGHVLLQVPPADKEIEKRGTALRAKIDALNARAAADVPDEYVPVVDYLSSRQAFTDMGLTPTAADLADIAEGFIPETFRLIKDSGEQDTLHYNQLGYAAMTPMIVAAFAKQGVVAGKPVETTPAPGTPTPSDVDGPTITYAAPAIGAAFSATDSVTFEADVLDASGIATIGVFGDAGQPIGVPQLVNGNRWRLVAPAAKVAGIKSWRVASRDTEGNVTYGSFRSIAIAAAAEPTTAKPVIQITTPAGREVRDEWVVNANITHPDGIQAAVVYGQGSGKSVMIGDMVKGQGDAWSALILPGDVPAGTNRFSVIALSGDPSAISAGSPEVPVTILSQSDQTAPTAAMTSPVAGSVVTLDGDLVLRALAIDNESGVASVEFLSDAQILPFAVGSNLGSNIWGRTVSGSEVPSGTTKVRARVKDVAGNEIVTGPVGITLQVPANELWLTLSPTDLLPLNPRVREKWIAWLGGTGGPVGGDGGAATALLTRDDDGRLYDNLSAAGADGGLIARDDDGRIIDTQTK